MVISVYANRGSPNVKTDEDNPVPSLNRNILEGATSKTYCPYWIMKSIRL